jgi:hypothetical protein
MTTLPIPSALEQLITRAKTSKSTATFSRSWKFDPALMEKVQGTITTNPALPASYTITNNPDMVTQFAIALEDTIELFTRPTYAEDSTGMPVYIGSIGDSVGQVFPAAIDSLTFSSEFSTLLPKGLADSLRVTKLQQPPDLVPGPTTVTTEDGTEVQTPPSLERLHFGNGENEDETPVFALLPVCLPIPNGVLFPTEGLRIGEINAELEASYPAFALWHKGVSYAINHNEAKSVTEGGPLFHTMSIEKEAFANHTISPNIRPTIIQLLPGSALSKEVRKIISLAEQQAWLRIAETLPVAQEPNEAAVTTDPVGMAVTGTPQNLIKEMFEGFAKITQAKHSLSETEQISQAEQHTRAFCVMGASLKPDEENSSKLVVVPAEPTDLLLKITKATSNSTAKSHFSEAVANAAQIARQSTDRLLSAVTMNRSMVDGAFIAAIRTANFMTVAYFRQPEQIRRQINMAVFATPRISTVQYQQRVTAENTLQVQEQLQEHSKNMQRKATELYVEGALDNAQRLFEMLANFYLTMTLLVKNFEDSVLWQVLRSYEEVMRSSPGYEFFHRYERMQQVALNVCADTQTIMSEFANLGTHANLRDAVDSGTPIDPNIYLKAKNNAMFVLSRFSLQIMSGTAEGYDKIPNFASQFPQLDTLQKANINANEKKSSAKTPAKEDGKGNSATKSQKTDKQSSPTIDTQTLDNLKTKGFLIWSGEGNPPDCPVRIKFSNRQGKERICMAFVCQGAACKYGKKCHFVHLANPRSLTEAEKAKLDEFVNAQANLKYAKAPVTTGTNST